MNVNQESFDRRLAAVQRIYGLQSTKVTPLAYVEPCPFPFPFIYRVDLAAPGALPSTMHSGAQQREPGAELGGGAAGARVRGAGARGVAVTKYGALTLDAAGRPVGHVRGVLGRESEGSSLLKGWGEGDVSTGDRFYDYPFVRANRLLYDSETKRITFDWATPVTGLWDIGGGMHERNCPWCSRGISLLRRKGLSSASGRRWLKHATRP
ncbi:hypothetical protein F4775DRAFT_595371 [Biscogniauxia sp. FL1348]|nr:hypothetical protein F4775DRAFT_595371 [Biscogniauxia sp. FL1348]